MPRQSTSITLLFIILIMVGSLIMSDSHATDFMEHNHFETSSVWISDDVGWKAVWDTLDNDTGYDIAVSKIGLLYIAGASGDDAILLQYDALGQQLWNRSLGGTGLECANAVIVDDMNAIYIAGHTTSWGVGGADALFAKYDQAGNIIWSKTWGGFGDDKAQGICFGHGGQIYICGSSENVSTASTDIFVVSFDEAGTILSETILVADGDQDALDIKVTPTNTIYLAGTGQKNDTADFDMLLVALDSNGSERFTQFWGYSQDDSAHALEICADGNILITGYYSQPGWSAPCIEFDGNGSFVNAHLYEPEWDEGGSYWGYDIVCTNDNSVYVVGKTPLGGRIFQTYRNSGYTSTTDSQIVDAYYGITSSMDEEFYVVGEGTFDLSTRFVRIENFRQFEGYTYDDDIFDTWSYSGNGVATELTVADFTGDEIKEVIAVFYTIENWWVEVITSGSLLWSFFPEGDITQLNAQPAQFDSDTQSELLVCYRVANLNETSLVALDSDGSTMWQWHGNLTNRELILADLDSDNLDEVCLELVSGIEVLESDSTVRWKIDGDVNTTWTVYDSGDYDRNGQTDIVVSKRNNATTPATLECIVIDGDRNIISQFPFLTTEVDQTTNSTGVALTIEMANFFGDEKLGFYYVTTDDGIHISEFIVNFRGESIGYSSPWNEWRNQTWYESCRVVIYDFDNDTLCEILRMTPYGDLCLMDSFGHIIWINRAFPQLLWTPHNFKYDHLWDFDGDTKLDLVTILSYDDYGVYQIDEIYLVDPQTGNGRYVTARIYGRAQYVTDVDSDDVADILVTDVYRVRVVKYGYYSFYQPDFLIQALIMIGFAFSILAVAAWFIYDYARGLPTGDNFKDYNEKTNSISWNRPKNM